MANMSDQNEASLGDRFFFQVPRTRPTSLQLAIYGGAIDDSGTGAPEIIQPGGRASVSMTGAMWAVGGGIASNIQPISTPAADTTWSVAYWALLNGGVPWYVGQLLGPVTVTAGLPFTLAPGKAVIAFGGNLTAFGRQALAAYEFLGTVPTWPEAVRLALTSNIPTLDVAGTKLTGNAYTDLLIPCTATYWVRQESTVSNGITLPFAQAQGGPWLPIKGVDTYRDVSTDRWFFKDMTPGTQDGIGLPVNELNIPTIRPNQLAFNFK